MLELRGLRAGNLRNLDLDLPHGCWTGVHGPSGAGKSALLFGVLEPIARKRFKVLYDCRALPGGDKKWQASICDDVKGMQPVVSLAGEIPRGRKKQLLLNAMNLWPRLLRAFEDSGLRNCLSCGHQWGVQGEHFLMQDADSWQQGDKVFVLVEADGLLSEDLLLAGWTRVKLNDQGVLCRLEEAPDKLPANSWLLIDRFKWNHQHRQRLQNSLATGLRRGGNLCLEIGRQKYIQTSTGRCPKCTTSLDFNLLEELPQSQDQIDSWVLNGRTWSEWLKASVEEIHSLPGECLDDCDRRIRSLVETGMGHLQLDRSLGTLSLGEGRRLELCAVLSQVRREQLVLFDEPGMGLHGSERRSVVSLLRNLVVQGNTVLTADPAREFLEGADHFVRLGPGGGPNGGTITEAGERADLPPLTESLPALRKHQAAGSLVFEGIQFRCLDIPKLEIPLGSVVAICGVSGCGKSTMLEEELLPRLRARENVFGEVPEGGVAVLLERALGSAAVSTIATLSGAWAEIRKIFAGGEEGLIRGLSHSDLVAKDSAGACSKCRGHGLDADRIPCSQCKGLGLRDDLLELRLRSKSLRNWLTTPLNELESRLPHSGKLRRLVRVLCELGMSDRCFGERGKNLSLGERSRIALARELATSRPGIPRLFLLDEPCLGLPPEEAIRVVEVLRRLSLEGHSFWVVEHNEVMLRCADYILELGPGAGPDGGKLVYAGSAEDFTNATSATANWLRSRIKGEAPRSKPPALEKSIGAVVDEDFSRKGRRNLQHDLLRELATRSPLAADMLAGDSVLGELMALPPVAWPIPPKATTNLADVLGVSGSIRDALYREGSPVCATCGGKGPWADVAEAIAANKNLGTEFHILSPLNLSNQEHDMAALLRAAGFRRLWRKEERILMKKGVAVRHDDLVLLDSCSAEEMDGFANRLREAEHHARLLGNGVLQCWDIEKKQISFQYQSKACRDCNLGSPEHACPMESRLHGFSGEQLLELPMGDALKHLVKFANSHGPFEHALEILKGQSLLRHPLQSRLGQLTFLESKLASLVGWILFPVEGVVLLHDQPLAGLPAQLSQRLRKKMLQGLHRFTDAERGIANKDCPDDFRHDLDYSAFGLEFDLEDWSLPGLPQASETLSQALGINGALRSQFLLSEAARLGGWSETDLGSGKGARKCKDCRGHGALFPHPKLPIPCSYCHGSGWDPSTRALEVRGLNWFDLERSSLAEIAEHFVGTPAIEIPARRATELGMGEWRLGQKLDELPEGARSLCVLAAYADAEELRIATPMAGCTHLEAERIAVTMGGYLFRSSRIEIKGHHPRILPSEQL